MSECRERFLTKCKGLNISASHSILLQLSSNQGDRDTLTLTGISLNTKTCIALADALSTDTRYKSLILADCFLGDDGCIAIMHSLKTNQSIENLDLRGNNIRGDGAVAIAQALRLNKTVKSISLEWNCIGVFDTGIHALSDAMSVNQTLVSLDLRNNKISSSGTQHLCVALKHNSTLKKLGMLGARSVIDLLQWNSVVYDIELGGNDITEELLRAIGLDKNRKNHSTFEQNIIFANELTNTIDSLSKSHLVSLSELKSELSCKEIESYTFSEKLNLASLEISSCHDVQRMLEKQLEDALLENKVTSARFKKENKNLNERFDETQRLLIAEREKRLSLENMHDVAMNTCQKKRLDSEANFRDAVLEKDKRILLEELEKHRQRETTLNVMWDDKIKRMESRYVDKLTSIEQTTDSVLLNERKKSEDKMHVLREENSRLEESLDAEKDRWSNKRKTFDEEIRHIMCQNSDKMDHAKQEFEQQLTALRATNEALKKSLETNSQKRDLMYNERESDLLKQMHILKSECEEQIQSLKHRLKSTTLENEANLVVISKLTERERESVHRCNALDRSLADQTNAHNKESHQHTQMIQTLRDQADQRDKVIAQLKATITSLEDELNDSDRENVFKMKELQLSINMLMEKRSTRQHTRIIA